MDYKKLVEVYSQLEATTKKLEKTDILATFLKKVSADQLSIIVLFLQGRIFPEWSEEELGVADSLMVKTLSKVTGIDEHSVKQTVKREGDMGLAAESLLKKKKQTTLASGHLSIDRVYSNFIKIPTVKGSGSVQIKIGLLADLLSDASPMEGKYLTRIVLGDLRIGVAEGLIRQAIAKAFDIPSAIVEHAHNVRNDFGEVAQIAKEKGQKGLEKLSLSLERPIKPMLAQKAQSIEEALEGMGGKAAFEIKFDGMRVQIHKDKDEIKVFTRRLDNVTKQFPKIAEWARDHITATSCIIEGEAVGIDPETGKPQPFQQLSRRIKRKYDVEKIGKKIPVEVNLFDLMYLNGTSWVDKPFEERRVALKKIIKPLVNKFQVAEQVVTDDPKEAEKLYTKALKMGHEGIMVKNLQSPYTPGSRVKHMNKIKPVKETLDLAIIGAIWGEGRRSKWLGSFILGARDQESGEFLSIGKVATGLTDENLEELTQRLKPLIEKEHVRVVEIKPDLVLEVEYEEIQKSPTYDSGFALRFPRVKTIRDDKAASDADTIERVSRLYTRHKK